MVGINNSYRRGRLALRTRGMDGAGPQEARPAQARSKIFNKDDYGEPENIKGLNAALKRLSDFGIDEESLDYIKTMKSGDAYMPVANKQVDEITTKQQRLLIYKFNDNYLMMTMGMHSSSEDIAYGLLLLEERKGNV